MKILKNILEKNAIGLLFWYPFRKHLKYKGYAFSRSALFVWYYKKQYYKIYIYKIIEKIAYKYL